VEATLPNYPGLAAEHVRDARLFANREDMLLQLPIVKAGKIAEVGVMRGDFSEFMINTLRPRRFVAFDLFTAHTVPQIWGIPSSQVFDGLTHLDYYRRRFARLGDLIVTEPGPSRDTLPKYANGGFDLIYIDAGHDYESVRIDAELSARMINDSGFLVFNDYIVFDHIGNCKFGVVPVVNTMVAERGWQVFGLALHREMFCDIAIRRDPSRMSGRMGL
jgi:Methyltransferase domain